MWFRKQKKQQATGTVQDRMAIRIAGAITGVQRKLCGFISKGLLSLPVNRLKALLIFFCLLGSGSSIYQVASVIRNRDGAQGVILVERLHRPGHVSKAGDEILHTNAAISKEMYYRLQDFKRYMDSLMQDAQGKKLYDSLLLARPYLMDSFSVQETIYQSQHKH